MDPLVFCNCCTFQNIYFTNIFPTKIQYIKIASIPYKIYISMFALCLVLPLAVLQCLGYAYFSI